MLFLGGAWPPQARAQSSKFLVSGPDTGGAYPPAEQGAKQGNLKAKKKGEVFCFQKVKGPGRRTHGLMALAFLRSNHDAMICSIPIPVLGPDLAELS